MSYILEALRRAETERERKRRVPGLHTQPVPVLPPEEPGTRRSKAWLWVVVGLGAGLLLALLWHAWPREPAAEEALATRTTAAGNVTPQVNAAPADTSQPASAAAPAPAPLAPNATATNPAAAPQAPGTQPTHPAAKAAATPRKTGTAAQGGRTAATTAHTATAINPPSNAGAKPAPVAAPPRASEPEPRLRSLAELPDDLRRSVPQLTFGGSVYSEVAAQRMVILNGQVLREGDSVTDELLLEQIRPRSAVLRLRGQRFEVVF